MHDANRRQQQQQPPPPHEGLGREQRAAAANLAEEVGTAALALQLARRPALQGLGPVVFMNGFGQGAMPVCTILREAIPPSFSFLLPLVQFHVLLFLLARFLLLFLLVHNARSQIP
jgi:hypothetical protein